MWPWKRMPSEPWVYLGWNEISYFKEDPKNITEQYVIHFHGSGPKLRRRKVDFREYSEYAKSAIKRHYWYQKVIVPWLNGGDLWMPIAHPSDDFKDWTKRDCGFTHVNGAWVKPAPTVERSGDIIHFPRKDTA